MISITTHQTHFELRLNFSFGWLPGAIKFMRRILSFHEIREIERRKQRELYEMGLWLKAR